MSGRLVSSSAGYRVRDERDIRARLGDQPFDFESMDAIQTISRAASTVRNHMERKVLRAHRVSWASFTVMWVLWIRGEQETRRVADWAASPGPRCRV